jgi:hypothetical protein
VGAQLSGYGFPHYYAPLLVPAAALVLLLRVPAGRAAPAVCTGVATLVVVTALAVTWPFAHSVADTVGRSGVELARDTYGVQSRLWTPAPAVGALIRRRAAPGDRMLVLGAESEYYWTSGVRPASYYIYDPPSGVGRARYHAAMQRDVCGAAPRFLVDPQGSSRPRPACLADQGYRLIYRYDQVRVFELDQRSAARRSRSTPPARASTAT